MSRISETAAAMVDYYAGDIRRINHFLKVYALAKTIGEQENLAAEEQEILEIAALTHDIGIRNSELKYNSSAGNYQQIEGPPEAEKMLPETGCGEEVIREVCRLIACHHTYDNIEDIKHRILVEADFLVNAHEDGLSGETVRNFANNVFRTGTGKHLLEKMYG